jgi:2,3-bisphosphoglycerate-independent phosphoglycerate mutase
MQEMIRDLIVRNETKDLIVRNETKIVLLVLDGLGGLPWPDGPEAGKTELEAAHTPNLDALARESACGLHTPVEMGITPGSGPGHLGLFGYDPREFQIGRGILEALGLGVEIKSTDIALRCNYCTMRDGLVVDRRAGRIPTPESGELTQRLKEGIKKIDEAEVLFAPGMEHRFAVRMRFPEPLKHGSAAICDTDPQVEGKAPLAPVTHTREAERVVRVVEKLLAMAAEILKGEEKANHILMRGFSEKPHMPSFEEAFGLRALAVASYPMYRGVAKLVGMEAMEIKGDIKEEVDFLRANYSDFDFFFVHVKKVDSYGEDGNFSAKSAKIAEVDSVLPEILALKPDVLIVTGDHSTPALLKSHSWHPVPVLIKSPYVLGGLTSAFSERECVKGELGTFPTIKLIPFALANSGRLKKFGA